MSCPNCGKETDHKYRPFCSKRCADVDLARWFNESYSIPAVDEDDPDDEDVQRDTPPPTRH